MAHLTVARFAEALGVSWSTANDAVLAEGRQVLIDDSSRFDVRAKLVPFPAHDIEIGS